jgi:hypothetical protein
MSRTLDALNAAFFPKAVMLLARLTEAEILVMITCTGRTQAEQDQAFATGHSQVRYSKHQDGFAIDVCPYQQYIIHGANKLQWDRSDPIWAQMGKIGELISGIGWGGRFRPLDKNGMGWDPGHFELSTPVTTAIPSHA